MKTTQTDRFDIVSDIQDRSLGAIEKAILTDKVARFIEFNLGEYPHRKLLVTEIDVKKNPIYGLKDLGFGIFQKEKSNKEKVQRMLRFAK